MSTLYPSKKQFTIENVSGWLEKLGPMKKITPLTDADDGHLFELEIEFEPSEINDGGSV